jgi:hypothetical protein
MVPPTPTPSPRLLRAAHAEREQLERHRRELLTARETLRAEMERIEGSLQAVAERQTLLDRLVGPSDGEALNGPGERRARRAADHVVDDGLPAQGVVLRGPAIRREAVRVLLAHPDQPEAIHYRSWFSLLGDAGFGVAGKDPLATFLTQLSRSPAVRKTTQAGVYALDRGAAPRLRRRVDELHEDLRALPTGVTAPAEAAAIRTRRSELTAELSRVEKALEEVEVLFAAPYTHAAEPAVVG